MIAVFAEKSMLRGFNVQPKHQFIFVKSKEDIREKEFTGVIVRFDIWQDKQMSQAYVELKRRQPELFK